MSADHPWQPIAAIPDAYKDGRPIDLRGSNRGGPFEIGGVFYAGAWRFKVGEPPIEGVTHWRLPEARRGR